MKVLPLVYGSVALTIFSLSAGANAYTGYSTGGMIGVYGAYFGASFMLVTELFTPLAMLLKHKVNPNYTVIQKLMLTAGVVMGIGVSVGSFWNAVNTGLTKEYADLAKTIDTKKQVVLESEVIKLDDQSNEVSEEKLVQPHETAVYNLKNIWLKNSVNQNAYRDGQKLLLWDGTNHCTSKDYYGNAYSKQCSQIAYHESQIRKIKADNAQRVKNIVKASDNASKRVDLQTRETELNYQKNTTAPIVLMLVSSAGNDPEEARAYFSSVSFYVAVFSEIMKLSFIAMFIMTLTGAEKKPRSGFIASLINEWRTSKARALHVESAARGKRLAELEHDHKVARSKPIIFDAVEYMSCIKYNQLTPIYDFDSEFENKQSDPTENKMLLSLVVREYVPDGKIVIRATLGDICEKVSHENSQYVKQMVGEFKVKHSELVSFTCDIAKPYRLRTIIFPALVNSGLAIEGKDPRGGKTYQWVSEKDIENIFKNILK